MEMRSGAIATFLEIVGRPVGRALDRGVPRGRPRGKVVVPPQVQQHPGYNFPAQLKNRRTRAEDVRNYSIVGLRRWGLCGILKSR
jgi:hypothetical protein